MVGLLTIVQSIMAISGIAFALLMRSVIDHAVSKEYEEFWQSVVALAVLICLQLLLRFVNRFLEEDTHAAIENRLRQKTLHGILQSNAGSITV